MSILSFLKTSTLYAKIRSIRYKAKRLKTNQNNSSLSLSSTKQFLEHDLGLRAGDSVLVHCGFGFLNANYSPSDLVELLKEIITPEGNILMPFYPPGLSLNWALSGRIFDPYNINCSTGVLAQTFLSSKSVVISQHPVKAVIAWGKDAKNLVSGHENSLYPFDKSSPYYKLALIPNSKSLGLGVLNCAMVHCAEDLYEKDKDYLYDQRKFSLKTHVGDGSIKVDTFVHHDNLSRSTLSLAQFVEKHLESSSTVVFNENTPFYVINNLQLLEGCERLFSEGVNRAIR